MSEKLTFEEFKQQHFIRYNISEKEQEAIEKMYKTILKVEFDDCIKREYELYLNGEI
jgi:hypothetical protein